MKMRIVKLNPAFLIKAIQGRAKVSASNLPEDVELLGVKYDLFTKQVFIIVRSDSFEDVSDAYPIPELDVTYTSSVKPETKPVIKPNPVAIEESEAKHVEKKIVPTNQDIRAVEEEFSLEQRELLRFTSDGDYVIIKPTQYLKAEWNEINDVVRSLGGKWVKGDLSSYWEIPPE